MKSIILAAGYATRMYPLTADFPKPLLKIGTVTILDRLVSDMDRCNEISSHIIVTNQKFCHIFEDWKQKSSYTKPITIINDGSTTNDNRKGAVKDILLALDALPDDEDILVLAADNVLDFSLQGFIDYYNEKQTSLIMCHHEESITALQRTGVVCLDADNKVLLMEEKPEKPKTHWAVPPFYIYTHKDYPTIRHCIENGCNFDAPGNLAHHLCEKSTVHAWKMPGKRYDIGDLATYERYKNGF